MNRIEEEQKKIDQSTSTREVRIVRGMRVQFNKIRSNRMRRRNNFHLSLF